MTARIAHARMRRAPRTGHAHGMLHGTRPQYSRCAEGRSAWPRPSTLLPAVLLGLGSMLALNWAGDLLDTVGPTRGAFTVNIGHERSGSRDKARDSREFDGEDPSRPREEGERQEGESEKRSKETPENVPPTEGASGAASVPAGAKMAQGAWFDTSRSAGGSRPAAYGVLVLVADVVSAATKPVVPGALPAASLTGRNLRPLGPRGPPTVV